MVNLLRQEATILGHLLLRLGSERMMEKELPEEVTVVTRRHQIETLQASGAWASLRESQRHLLLLPDGHWSCEDKKGLERGWELLDVLRWTLLLDSDLPTLAQHPAYHFKKIEPLTQKDVRWGRLDAQPSWELRAQRNATQAWQSRLYCEAGSRGWLDDIRTPEELEPALSFREEIRKDSDSIDALVGTHTVMELSGDRLGQALRRASDRYDLLASVLAVMDGEAELPSIARQLDQVLYPLLEQAFDNSEA